LSEQKIKKEAMENKRPSKYSKKRREYQNRCDQMYDHKLSKFDQGNNVGMFYKGWGGKRKLHSSYKTHGTIMKNPKQCPNLRSIPS
jgi:hypothetical protein